MAPAFPQLSCHAFPCQPNGRKKPDADVTKAHVTVENGTLTVVAVSGSPLVSCPVAEISPLNSMLVKIARATTFLSVNGEDWAIDFQLSLAHKRAKRVNKAFRTVLEAEGMRRG